MRNKHEKYFGGCWRCFPSCVDFGVLLGYIVHGQLLRGVEKLLLALRVKSALANYGTMPLHFVLVSF